MKSARALVTSAFLLVPMAATGCGSSTPSSATATTAPAEKTYPPAPAGSPFAKIKLGMDTKEVTDLIGPPTDTHAYMTGKGFIPFYYGGDTHRIQFMYKGEGRIVFTPDSRFTSGESVSEIEYDPTETGYNH